MNCLTSETADLESELVVWAVEILAQVMLIEQASDPACVEVA